MLIDRRARVVGNAVVPHGPDVGAIHGVAAQRVGPIQGVIGGIQAVIVAGHPVGLCDGLSCAPGSGNPGATLGGVGAAAAASAKLVVCVAAVCLSSGRPGQRRSSRTRAGRRQKAPYQRGLGGRCRGGAGQWVQYPVDGARHQVGHGCQRILRRLGDRRLRCLNCGELRRHHRRHHPRRGGGKGTRIDEHGNRVGRLNRRGRV